MGTSFPFKASKRALQCLWEAIGKPHTDTWAWVFFNRVKTLSFSSFSSFPLGFVGLDLSPMSLPRWSFSRKEGLYYFALLVMFATSSSMTIFFNSVIPLGSIPHTTSTFFKILSLSSCIPWTSTVFTNLEQSHSISSICTKFWHGGGVWW